MRPGLWKWLLLLLSLVITLGGCPSGAAKPPTASSYQSRKGHITPTPYPVVTPWPTPVSVLLSTPTPFCRPSGASVSLSAISTTLEVGEAVTVTATLVNGASDAKLGLIQYSLSVQPQGALTSNDLGPVEHRLSLEPGQSDAVEFVLQAAAPGRATLTGSTSFEIHALDYSWGSWSGCQSGPLEIVVRPNDDLQGREGHAYPEKTIAVTKAHVWVGFGSSPGGGGGVRL